MTNKMTQAIPFLKWAGGKRWLTGEIRSLVRLPIVRYVEPFLGGGSVFFDLRPKSAVLSDLNENLINSYAAIQQDWTRVDDYLIEHQLHHCFDYYYRVRGELSGDMFERAARFIYLNRTCWNGLYRVNKRGQFNVPIGTKSSVLLESDSFSAVADALKDVVLSACDFERTIDAAMEGDLIFADPPYTVKHNVNGFLKYNEKIFSFQDQIRLRDALVRAKTRGARVVATNAFHESVIELYAGDFNLGYASRFSVIASAADKRRECEELIIWGV